MWVVTKTVTLDFWFFVPVLSEVEVLRQRTRQNIGHFFRVLAD